MKNKTIGIRKSSKYWANGMIVFCGIILFSFLLPTTLYSQANKPSTNKNSRISLKSGDIVFSSNASGGWNLWSVRPDGADAKQLAKNKTGEHFPAISPDKTEILYVDSKRSLRCMKADGSDNKKVPLPKGIYGHPCWAPDGKKFAFVKYRVNPSDQSEIWTIKRENDGIWQQPERITQFPPMRIFPSFSPDGLKLAYAEFHRDKQRGAVEEIGILHLDTKKQIPVTTDGADSFHPVWSPSGDQIVYVSNKSGNYDLWVYSFKADSHKQLTWNVAYDGEPTWSPDGTEIAFVSTRSNTKELWIISSNGHHLRQVTRMEKVCKNPVWVK